MLEQIAVHLLMKDNKNLDQCSSNQIQNKEAAGLVAKSQRYIVFVSVWMYRSLNGKKRKERTVLHCAQLESIEKSREEIEEAIWQSEFIWTQGYRKPD